MSLGIDERPQRRPDSPELWRHLPQPNYTRPLLEISAGQRKRLLGPLIALYGHGRAQACFGELERIMRVYYAHRTLEMIRADQAFNPADRFSERDIILITYGDLLTHPQKKPLRALTDFLGVFMHGVINTVHLLPFFPYSSDRGFSIIDYEEVDPRLGAWEEIEEMSLGFRLMFDGVFNHVSSKSRWFQEFLNGNPYFQDFFIHYPNLESISDEERKLIVRPRTSDLLTAYNTINGPAYLWTTFSPDQIDLNFKSEKVLLKVIQILLYYLWRGADLIRLDAVTYLWAELGTSCALLDQTHLLVQLYRAVLDVVAPHPALVTESNVPHQE
ncbi:MAG: sugar phosphorylase, partial [Deltaproteobacteria bacterium]|nr:sugar phosphorylase [Deltaproteobacteria bacterium]